MAEPPGMFSVVGTMPITFTLHPSAGSTDMAAITAAAPAMSVFIVIMPSAVLSDRPPESKVMPLPTSATVPRAPGGFVRQADEPGGLVGPRGHARQRAQALGLDRLLVEDLDGEAGALGHVGGDGRQPPRRHRAGRLVDEVAGQAHGTGDGRTPVEAGLHGAPTPLPTTTSSLELDTASTPYSLNSVNR